MSKKRSSRNTKSVKRSLLERKRVRAAEGDYEPSTVDKIKAAIRWSGSPSGSYSLSPGSGEPTLGMGTQDAPIYGHLGPPLPPGRRFTPEEVEAQRKVRKEEKRKTEDSNLQEGDRSPDGKSTFTDGKWVIDAQYTTTSSQEGEESPDGKHIFIDGKWVVNKKDTAILEGTKRIIDGFTMVRKNGQWQRKEEGPTADEAQATLDATNEGAPLTIQPKMPPGRRPLFQQAPSP